MVIGVHRVASLMAQLPAMDPCRHGKRQDKGESDEDESMDSDGEDSDEEDQVEVDIVHGPPRMHFR